MATITASASLLLFLRSSVVFNAASNCPQSRVHLRFNSLPPHKFSSRSLHKLPSLSLLYPAKSSSSLELLLVQASLNPSIIPNSPPNPPLKSPIISDSTKTLAALFALSFSLSSKIAHVITNFLLQLKSRSFTPTPQELQTLQFLQDNVLCAAGPLFFASIRSRPTGYLNTPLTVVASGMAKWLDIYSGVLMVRVLLSWFPNIPWDRQPLSAIRDLCDPYLNLFRNIIPPIGARRFGRVFYKKKRGEAPAWCGRPARRLASPRLEGGREAPRPRPVSRRHVRWGRDAPSAGRDAGWEWP